MSKLTSWDAPIKSRVPWWNLWKRFTGGEPWYSSRAIYLPYILIIGFQASAWLAAPHATHYPEALNIGFNAGFIFMTFFGRISKRSEAYLDKLKEDYLRYEIEAKVRAEYERKYGHI